MDELERYATAIIPWIMGLVCVLLPAMASWKGRHQKTVGAIMLALCGLGLIALLASERMAWRDGRDLPEEPRDAYFAGIERGAGFARTGALRLCFPIAGLGILVMFGPSASRASSIDRVGRS